jgi:hypothetical protein
MLPVAYTWSLTGIAIAVGMTLLWVFGRFSDQPRIAAAKGRLRANLYAFRLFSDEPGLIWRAQKQLVVWNARYIAAILRPTAVIILPMAGLLVLLDGVYGHRPLRVGETAIASANIANEAATPSLGGSGFVLETPPVRVAGERRVYWRVRATSSRLMLRRGAIENPVADIDVFGTAVHWLVWFTIVSLLTMLALRKQFHVTF